MNACCVFLLSGVLVVICCCFVLLFTPDADSSSDNSDRELYRLGGAVKLSKEGKEVTHRETLEGGTSTVMVCCGYVLLAVQCHFYF